MCAENKEMGMEIKVLKPENVELILDEEQEINLKLIDENKIYERVEVNPAFPLSQVGQYISFKEDEDAEEEIGIIEDIVDLDPDSQNALERVLEKIYFMPRITKIYEVEEEFGVTRWEVETEKGRRSFDIKSRRRDIRPYDNGRIIFHDIDGNRYEITDYRKLDKNSQKRLRSEI
ncbi:MAG: DUF1854 domain-containing protein [Halanaerobiales bacterium]